MTDPQTSRGDEGEQGTETEASKGPVSMSFLDHLEELRRRLLVCVVAIGIAFVVCYAFSGPILRFLLRPLQENIFANGDIVYINLTEPFLIYMKAAFFGSIILASPVIFFEIWRFISPGLHQHEKKWAIPFLAGGPFLFVSGAAFAYVLSRVAGADLHITEIESAKMVELVHRMGQLTEAQALLVVEIAKSQQRLFGGTENFLVTREFRDIASAQQRFDVLHCLFAVAAADASISSEEEAQLWQIAGELGFSRVEFMSVRNEYSTLRSVLQPDRTTPS